MPPKPAVRSLLRSAKQSITPSITHPLAKYDSSGRLSCIACEISIKASALWNQHLASKSHKETIQRLRNLKEKNGLKRRIDTEEEIREENEKKVKFENYDREISGDISLVGNENEEAENQESKEDVNMAGDSTLHAAHESSTEVLGLPADFFDSDTQQTPFEAVQPPIAESEVSNTTEEIPVSAIPEGFFDDPKLDAHARNVPQPEVLASQKLDKEYEAFTKEIAAASEISEETRDQDDEELWRDRQEEEERMQDMLSGRVGILKKLRGKGGGDIGELERIKKSIVIGGSDDGLMVSKTLVEEVLRREIAEEAKREKDNDDNDNNNDVDEDMEDWDDWRAQGL